MKKLKRFIKHGERQGANPPDIPSKDDSVAVLVTSSKTNVALRSEQTSAPAITTFQIESSLGLAESTHDATAGMETLQSTTDKPTGNPTAASASSSSLGSLWDAAYNELRDDIEAAQRIDAYETLLRHELGITDPDENGSAGHTMYPLRRRGTVAGQEKLAEITRLGLEYMEKKKVSAEILGHVVVLQDVVEKVAKAVEWGEDYIKDAAKDLPYASIVMVGVSLVLPLLKNPAAAEIANRDGFAYVTSQMRYYTAMEPLLLPSVMRSEPRDDLRVRLRDLYKLIIDFQVRSVLRFYRNRTENFFRGTVDYDSWTDKLNVIKSEQADLSEKCGMATFGSNLEQMANVAQNTKELADMSRKQEQRQIDTETREYLRHLSATEPSLDRQRIVETKGGLLEDSYRWVLDNPSFLEWRDSTEGQLLWVKGDPGKGKTMLLCGIINELTNSKSTNQLLSYFFCQSTDSRLNHAAAVLKGLIYMLVKQQPALVSHVKKLYDPAGEQVFEGVNAWTALSEILSNILQDPDRQPALLIIDALDECGTAQQSWANDDLSRLLNFIVQNSALPNVKWIVSSRNWSNIGGKLNAASQKVQLRLELNQDSISKAVSKYIEWKVKNLALEKQYSTKTQAAVLSYLSSNANDTFLWVALVCQELGKTLPAHTLSKLQAFPPGLDPFYRRMESQISSSEDAILCQRILAVSTTVYRPITLDEMRCLVDIPDALSDDQSLVQIVGLCGSFLILRERTIFFVHQSAKEFVNRSRTMFPLGGTNVHYQIFSRSLQAMRQTLKRDIYRLRDPGILIDEIEKPVKDPLRAVGYSCVYWTRHLTEANRSHYLIILFLALVHWLGRLCLLMGVPTGDLLEGYYWRPDNLLDGGRVHTFLKEHLLHWLEALSLLKSVSDGVLAIGELKTLLAEISEESLSYTLIHDAHRFIRYHQWIIESSPLQVYASALLFSPTRSTTRKHFKYEEPDWIVKFPAMADDWSACLRTIEAHSPVYGVACSPDSTRIASGSGDGTISIWDSATGRCLSTLRGHTNYVTSIAWSPDTAKLASGSYDRTVKIWDLANCRTLSTLEGHDDSVDSVAWSRCGTRLASGSTDRTIKIWDPATGQYLLTLADHTADVRSVVWSPNTWRLASGSADGTVKIWDPATLQVFFTLEGHVGDVNSVAWSRCGTRLASGSIDGTIKIWDPETGQDLLTLEHGDWVLSVAFSPDMTRLASAAEDKVIKIWDPATGRYLATLEGHSERVIPVAWSLNAAWLVSGSPDTTIKIWDSAITTCSSISQDHNGEVSSLAWSRDAQQLGSGSFDCTLKIWDVATGKCLSTLKGHEKLVNSIDWSHDATRARLASASYDRTVRIWDPETGQCLQTLEGHTDSVFLVAWSQDGTQLASSSFDGRIKIWDTATGQCMVDLYHGLMPRPIAWSHDGTRLASESFGESARIWDVATGQCLLSLGHGLGGASLAWSQDAAWLVSASFGDILKTWDTATGECLSTYYKEGVRNEFMRLGRSSGAFGVIPAGMDPDSPDCIISTLSSGYGVSKDGAWITYRGKNMLWLPLEYRPRRSLISGTTIAIGCLSGRILFIEFSKSAPVG